MKRSQAVILVGGGNIISGKEIVMLHLARGLRRAGYRPVFITSVWGGKNEFVSRLKADDLEYYRVRLGFISKTLSWKPIVWTATQLIYWPALVIGYLNAVKASAPRAIVHTNWHHALLLMPVLDRRRDLYWSHEVVSARRHYGWIFRAIARRVSHVVCVSHAVRRSMEQIGVPACKLLVVHNGTPFDGTFQPPRRELPLRLGIVGQVGSWKGHGDALDALAQLPRGKAILKIFGTGRSDYIETLKEKATTLGISDLLEWHGFVADPAGIYNEIDVCIMPSRIDESFGMAALEASRFGRPVICSSRGGLNEIVEDKKTGFVVDAESPQKLADAIESFSQNPNLIATMGTAARDRAEREFSYARFVQIFIDLMEKLPKKDSCDDARTTRGKCVV
jgi:glycosyltransferase involved in cell wall biosynthesis